MKHRIKVHYRTGDSFNSHDTEDYLDLSWDDLEVAKKNLIAIKEHWKMYEEIESYFGKRSKEEILKDNKDKWWFVNENSQYCMKLKADNGNFMQQWNFWCGYFETLYGAEIETNNNDLKFEV